jgi:Flp pilus assembly protein TadD
VQLHLQPSGAVEHVQPEIGFYFSDQPPARTPTILRLGSQGIDIPPGESRFVIRDAYTLPVDVQLLATQPHAHYRAREIRGVADLPDGTSRLIMHIKDWDFRWQHVYRAVTPMRLPKGTRLSMEYTYDNSAANVRNPQLPPVRVSWGQRSKDEMGDLWFQLLAGNDRDRRVIDAEITRKMSAEDIVGYETMLRADPRDTGLHDDVAVLYLGMGRAADAVRHFEASAALRPASPAAQFNLGTALAHAGRLDDAVAAFGAALAARPDYGLAHTNLGRVLLTQGKTAEALSHLQEAVRLDGTNAQALFGLAETLAAMGSYEAAIAMANRALMLKLPAELAQQIRTKREEYLRRPPGP